MYETRYALQSSRGSKQQRIEGAISVLTGVESKEPRPEPEPEPEVDEENGTMRGRWLPQV
eukprot:COSAG01_NODE_39287_length_478_cov_2.646438_1_plen_59_part_01